jgi:5-methyltetrahydrofolate--homocysteine methyltransferase
MIDAMGFVGIQFDKGEMYVPEMLIAARAMKAGLDILKSLLVEKGTKAAGRVVIGTVRGDLHDIGKNLVAMMLEGACFEVIDLGVDVSPDRFVAAIDSGVDIVAMSALLTTTMPQMEVVIAALTEAGLRDRVKVMVGGAPITQAVADHIGADGYGPDASAATRLAKRLLGID